MEFHVCPYFMKYVFKVLELIIGGIIAGVIASLLFVKFSECYKTIIFNKRYAHLNSHSVNDFDWEGYSMAQKNGRIRQDNSNGSFMNINIMNKVIYIKVCHNSRIYNGEIVLSDSNYGVLTFKYEKEHEYGKKDCIIGSYIENNIIYDYFFLIPTTNNILSLKKQEIIDQYIVEYNYSNELFLRKRHGDTEFLSGKVAK
jgi:hypothetical protein